MRRVGVDGRQHDDHVTWAQGRVGTEPGQQLIVEDLHFALRAMGDVEADRAVLRRVNWMPTLAGFGERAQFEDIVLQLVEQRGGRAVTEQVDAAIAEHALVTARSS